MSVVRADRKSNVLAMRKCKDCGRVCEGVRCIPCAQSYEFWEWRNKQ